METSRKQHLPSLKVYQLIELPIEKASPKGWIGSIGFANDQQIYFTYQNQIYFLGLQGALKNKSSKKYGKGIVSYQKAVMSYDYEKVDESIEVTFSCYDVSAGNMQSTLQELKVKTRSNWGVKLSRQNQIMQLSTAFGLHITNFEPSSWQTLAFIPKNILDTYQTTFTQIVANKNLCVLASKSSNEIVLYDYVTEQVVDTLGLPIEGEFFGFELSPCGNYFVVHQNEDRWVQFISRNTLTVVFSSLPKVVSFDIHGDLLVLIYEDKVVEVYETRNFTCLGYCDYFCDSAIETLLFKWHATQPQLIVSDSDMVLVLGWGENESQVHIETTRGSKYTSYYPSIESWETNEVDRILNKIAGLSKQEKREKMLIQRYLRYRYQSLMDGGLKNLRNLPGKWEKSTVLKKIELLRSWPAQVYFFTPVIDLKAGRKEQGKQLRAEFPKNVGQIMGIKEIDFNHQDLKQIPSSVFDIPGLEVLRLEGTQLNNLPNKVLNLTQLKVLILKNNPVLKFVPDLGQLLDLEEVDLSYTNVKALPESFFELKKIRKVILTQSLLSQDAEIVKRLVTTFTAAAIITSPSKGQSSLTAEIQKEKLNKVGAHVFETQVKFKGEKIYLQLTNETNSLDATIVWANTLLKDLIYYEHQARQVLLDAHVSLEKEQKLNLSRIEVSGKKDACFIYSFIDNSGIPRHTFFVNTYNGGKSFEY